MSLFWEHFSKTASDRPNAPAVIGSRLSSVSFSQLTGSISDLQTAFFRLGICSESRCIVCLLNSVEFIEAVLALNAIGALVVLADSKMSGTELSALQDEFGCRYILSNRSFDGDVELTPGLRVSVKDSCPSSTSVSSDAAVIKLTSGSSGRPRGIATTEENLLADARNVAATMGIVPDDINLAAISMSHSYGFSNLFMQLITQGTAVVIPGSPFPRILAKTVAEGNVTICPLVPSHYEAFLKTPEIYQQFQEVRTFISAGGPLRSSTICRFHDATGKTIHSFYGASECGGIAYDRTNSINDVEGYVGTPLEGVSLDLVQAEDYGREVWVQSEAVAEGYVEANRTDRNEDRFVEKSFRTGDIAEPVGEGLKIVGRIQSLINVAGKKFRAEEVESVVRAVPGVKSVVILPIPDTVAGQIVGAFVELAGKEMTKTERRILEKCRTELSPHKVPRIIRCFEEFPLNERGKVDRQALLTLTTV